LLGFLYSHRPSSTKQTPTTAVSEIVRGSISG
jgi:hypothetical protein